jgi:hypothetical protein
LFRQESSLSVLSRSRIKADTVIPDSFAKANYVVTGIKKFSPYSQLVETKIQE